MPKKLRSDAVSAPRADVAQSVVERLITFRLQKAAYLLTHTYLSVKEIAHAAGYEYVSSFIRAFERKQVLTPTRYRERRKQG